mmetsp:Transcript_65188/g.142038  ORF Transcript_65188/g.142038 Transcript_65188/m.142038 type:complete len:475 (-) Transcript_65188:78-1502(-)
MPGAQNSDPNEENEEEEYLDRDHSWSKCVIISFSLSLCIVVDILQYSMPLSFLPSVLEDRGHSAMKIAAAIGVYYWTGFAGGAIITVYQIWRLLYGKVNPYGEGTVAIAQRRIRYLIVGLLIGTVTLIMQAIYPHWLIHLMCRFVQGMAGAFVFFYTFLLSVELFRGPQQVFSMTCAATALNVAEVVGSTLGAVLFVAWGQRSVFFFLGIVSLLNQVLLFTILGLMTGTRQPEDIEFLKLHSHPTVEKGLRRLKAVMFSRRLICTVILIVTAAMVKASVEEMLPFHADHEWNFKPLKIGELFLMVAVAYIFAAGLAGKAWQHVQGREVHFSAACLALLGLVTLGVFLVSSFGKHRNYLWLSLFAYGTCLGLTHTPAALLLADAIEHEDGVAKDAINGIWNTMWEAGGSLGFLLGGVLAENYRGQIHLLTAYCGVCILAAMGMMATTLWPSNDKNQDINLKVADGYGQADYGNAY